ncbi:bifunctional indole-3-glycerol-phosphate synthase TrpC/phosphoribosylanthranilate isomerase TrpF [Allosphingosinicella flava]|uniref:Multifunctional fusion protein n=1 Tax=Allosphingosinicella flava TaxID=2771430 RepID=A0A7T2GI74_9SPHN|nr:bifunctional indole-3-glycerol-phosphate synthase TrpC/phosphoribosylanthranilate isomerase TrpF [Sphingosinicella flava]QPQ54342.1 bifunctional indole-3-glycerol-phosphate synthase TrpC/phosphoribosylanthranilate isomerase TrpF [Sphingosinicella flava]
MRDPGGVLGKIVARKAIDVAARLGGADIGALRARAVPTTKNLGAALARPGARFIMEVKRHSPSRGVLRHAVDPAAMARAYSGAADAISVLTDTPFFGGSLDDLRAVRAVFSGPILAKDFVIDPRQVVEARLNGADAVLAMLSVLDDDEAAAIMAEAARLNMSVLVETHDEAEVARAVALGARIIGINNRDLTSMTTDLAVTERLAPLIPADRLVVSESGIEDRADALRLGGLCDAFLVGSSLMAAPNPGLAARELAFGRVKICGLTNTRDATAAAIAGAAYGGIILATGSPRVVSRNVGERIARRVREGGAEAVAVFQNHDIGFVSETAHAMQAAAVQLHGGEDEAYVQALRKRLPGHVELWGAAGVAGSLPRPRPGFDRTLYDTQIGVRTGGTGMPFDWRHLEGRDLGRDVLAGGIRPANVRRAARYGAYAIDIGSGVEAAPGRKDPAKLTALFAALRIPSRGEDQC